MRLFLLLATSIALAGCADPDANMAGNQIESADATAADMAEAPMGGPAPPATDGNDSATPPPANGADGNGAATPPGNGADDDADQCGASQYQYLVGKPRSSIPAQPAGARWRVTCTSCPVTMDFSPARLNIFYDEESEIVETVRCG